jgi:DNA processing protein
MGARGPAGADRSWGAPDTPGPPPDPEEWLARLRLARTRHVGPVAFRLLLARCGSARAALAALPELARRGGGQRLDPPSRAAAERERAAAARLGAQILVWGDAAYPRLLAAAEDAPVALVCLGAPARLADRCVAIVGARNASANGQRFASDLAAELVAAGLVVVSGLARGIDTAAHRGAGPAATVAVQAGGVDIVYPPENAALHAAIAGGGGAIVAELPPGTRPLAHHFPRRNRIVSGLSEAVVVVEAGLRSGSLITARLALDQGREVLAVPGFPLDPRAAGPNALLRDGAGLALSATDVLAALPAARPLPARPLVARSPTADPNRADPNRGESARADPRATGSGPGRSQAAPAPVAAEIALEDQAPGMSQTLLDLLGAAPTPVDELLRRCNVAPASAQLALLELELAGRVHRHSGNRVSRVF